MVQPILTCPHEMEDAKKDGLNKTKRSRNDHVRQMVLSYLQKRNYPVIPYSVAPPEEFMLNSFIENEISRPNSILYSCFNNDPVVIDHTFTKFITWLKELLRSKSGYEDLEQLIGPLFCHIYLEILRGGHTERASNFFKQHLPSVDRSKCDNIVRELISAFANDSMELPSLKDNFRSNKYVVQLSTDSVNLLKKFLAEAGHLVLLQVFQNWFIIEEQQESVQEVVETEEAPIKENHVKENQMLCNGHGNHKDGKLSMQRLLDAIDSIKKEPPSIYSVNISNIKDDVTSGVLDRQNGLLAYSYNNSIVLRSLQTLKELDNTSVLGEMVLLGHSARIYDMAFFATHRHLVSASQDKTVRLYNLQDYSAEAVYKGHEYPVYRLTTSCNGAYFASGSYDHSARLWSLSHKESLRIFVGHTQEVTSLAFHPNCTYLVTGAADKTIRMWSIKDAEPLRLYLGSKGAVHAMCVSPKGQYLATAGEDRRLRIWDILSAKQLIEIKTGSQPVTKIAIKSDESLLVTGSVDGALKMWDLNALIKTTPETNNVDPVLNINANPKLLSVDYCFGTFGCFTAQSCSSVMIPASHI